MMDILKVSLYREDLKKLIENFDFGELKDKTILITGAAGLIGSSLVDVLEYANETLNINVAIIVADINNSFLSLRYGEYKNIKIVEYNALNPVDFDFCFDYAIHCAGIASPNLYVEKPVETMLSNFTGLKNLLEYGMEHNCKRLLYVSSSEIYGNKLTDEAFSEETCGFVEINGVRSSYCEAKRASEILCKSFSHEYGVSTVIVRPGHIFGPTASENDKRVSSAFLYKASRKENLFLKSSGEQIRSYCYSLDCAIAIFTVLLKGSDGEAYNIGSSEIASIKQLSEMIACSADVKLSVDSPSESDLVSFNPMKNSSLNIHKIEKLGYKASFSIKEGITHSIVILKQIKQNNIS